MQTRSFGYIAVIIFFLFTLPVIAQDESLRVETRLVTMNVSVAKGGKAITGLKASDFVITDNGKRQDIDTFSAENAPVSYGIVYDLHPTTNERTGSVLEALRSFTKSLGPSDDFFITVFNERGSLTTEFVPTEDQIRRQADTGARSLYDVIFAASDRMLRARNGKRVLIVLTDGSDHNSEHSFRQLKARLRVLNLPVYGITFGGPDRDQYAFSDMLREGTRQTLPLGETNQLDKAAISDLSKATGGRTVDADVRNRYYLAALCSKVAEDIKTQYVLGFYPDKSDGKWHTLRVTMQGTHQRGLRVSSRRGYQSLRN